MPRLVGLMLVTAMFANPHFAAGMNGPSVQKLEAAEAADPYHLGKKTIDILPHEAKNYQNFLQEVFQILQTRVLAWRH